MDVTYTADARWHQPPDLTHRDVAGVAVDSADRVYLFTRHPHRIVVLSRTGEFLATWGEGLFTHAHAVRVGPDDAVYAVDNGDHTVRKFSPDGELLMTLGTPHQPSETGYVTGRPVDIHAVEGVTHPGPPFNGCTDVAVAPNGDIYVSDGYRNCRIHRFAADGRLLRSWGEVGSGPGQFRLPHGICLAADGRVFVADRENDRIQIFDPDGGYLGEWGNCDRPCAITFDPAGRLVVAELWRPPGNRSFVRDSRGIDLPSRLTVLNPDGSVAARWGDSLTDKAAPGNVVAPHAVAVDSRGDLYVGEVTYSFAIKPGLVGEDHAGHQIQKFTPVGHLRPV